MDDLDEYRQASTSFDALVSCDVSARYLRSPSGAERVMTVRAERGFFQVLGVAPIAGRTFRSDEARQRGFPEVVLRVQRGNRAAFACYRAAGFVRVSPQEEASFNLDQPDHYVWMRLES